jgi:hypothetical protein
VIARRNRCLDLLLTEQRAVMVFPEHLTDLRNSGLADETIERQRLVSVPHRMIRALLGFHPPQVESAYLIPFPDPRGGWMNHVRVKVFPSYTDGNGRTVKYLGPRGVAPRLFFPLVTINAVVLGDAPVWLVEGAKKALAVSQLGLPTVGFEGIEGWHARRSIALLPDFGVIPLRERVVEILPDGDYRTNTNVRRGAHRLCDALWDRGARARIRILTDEQRTAAAP